MLKKYGRLSLLLLLLVIVFSACSNANEPTDSEIVDEEVATVEVHEQLQKSCVSCHAIDESGKLERIDYVRKTPEGWSQTIARMQRLHGVQLTDEERETLITYLSKENGLAPEEAEPVQYWLANRQSMLEADPEDENVASSCIGCHAGGRFLAQRRTTEEWMNLKDFHLVMFPSIHLNHRHLKTDWPTEAELALEHLANYLSFDSEEWEKWKGKEHHPEGKWKVVGFQGTKGFYIGDSEFSKDGEHYKETKSIRYLSSDEVVNKSAEVRKYSGYMLRAQYSTDSDKFRGVYNILGDGDIIRGDWQKVDDWGIQAQETYYRVQTDKPEIIHVDVTALKKGVETEATVYGMNLTKLTKEDFVLPEGMTVKEFTAQSDELATIKVEVASSTESGTYEVSVASGEFHNQLTVYDSIDYVAIEPAYGVSRVGGAGPMDKQSTQFVAYAYSNGKDGQKGTEDDLMLMPVDAEWSFKPYPDPNRVEVMNYLGTIDENGLYTPREEGINEERPFVQENVTGATVFAKVKIDGKVFEAETHHIQTVPDYVNTIH